MAFDMSQFYQVFFEEAAEHLANLESLLLEVDRDNPDPEQLNAIFRAAHSIKGSSGTFGFNDMMEVTHVLETLLDRIRKGEQALTEDMVDAFLVAGDVLVGLLAAHKGEGEADLAAMASICARLQALCDAGNAPAVSEPAANLNAQPQAVAAGLAEAPIGGQILDVRFTAPAAGDGNMDSLLAELAALGEMEVVVRGTAASAAWHLRLTTEAGVDAVRDVVEFVADKVQVGPAGVPAPEEAYGLFEVDASSDSPAKEEAWGLFAPEIPEPASDTASGDGAWGLFDAGKSVSQDTETSAAVEDAKGAWGLFNGVPVPAAEMPAVAAPSERPAATVREVESDASGAYGFFTAVPTPEGNAEAPSNTVAPAPAPVQPVLAAVAQTPSMVATVATAAVQDAAPARDKAKDNKAAPVVKGGGDSSIRVSVEKVDQMINLVGELVITQAMLAQAAAALDPVQFERLMNGLGQLERNTRDLQESVMSIRMMPISVVFSRFPRVVRDLSHKLGKQVELKLAGESTELDKGLIERITDPLTHLIRNSLDHGIESPKVRAAAGKQAVGTITLSASHQSGNIVIEVGDDGAGLNREKILSKARSRGLPVSDGMSDQEVWQLIFEAGFSTADQVTEVSGRGVGMDVVKRNISAMGGRVDIQSMTGVGTRMTVRLPLTLAILDGMSVAVGSEHYIIPLNYVMESMQPTRAMLKTINGTQRLIQVRGEYLPVVALHEVFNVPGFEPDMHKAIMVILEADGTKAALLVDALVGQHQVVIKSLEANYRKVTGVSGATIMGDGRVALILDVGALVELSRRAMPVAA